MAYVLRSLICLFFVLLPSSCWAQTLGGGAILQGGPWAQGRAPMYTGQGSSQAVVMDSGPAGGGGVGVGFAEQLLTARGTGTPPYVAQGTGAFGTNWCDYDAPITNATGYHFLCLSANIHNDAYFAVGPGGIGTPGGLTFNINGIETTYTGAMPTLFSVGANFNGGLINVTNTPITTSGVLQFHVAGNSGGIPYFDTANSWASTSTLTANLPLVGGGPGVAPFVASKLGTTNIFATATGSFTSGDCISVTGGGGFFNLVDAGGPCTTGGGGGTVSAGLTNQMAYYPSNGTTVAGLPTAANGVLITDGSSAPNIASTLPTAVQGNITTVGTVGTGTWAGTAIAGIHGGTGLTSFTAGGILYSPTTTTVASSGVLTLDQPLFGGGAGAAPTVGTKSGNTDEVATVSGALVSGNCLKSDASGNAVDAGNPCNGIVFPGTDGGTANAHVVASTGFAATTNNIVSFVATSTNTSIATADVNGTGVKNIFISSPSGPVALSGGEITTGNMILLSYDGTQYQIIGNTHSSGSGLAMSSGLKLKNNVSLPNSRIDVSANSVNMLSASGMTLAKFSIANTIDALVNGTNGLDTGSLSPNTFYYVWEISNGTSTAGLLSLSSTSPTMPSGYGYKARLGAERTDGSSHFIKINQVGARAQYLVYSTMATSTSTVSVTTFIPPTSSTLRAIVTTGPSSDAFVSLAATPFSGNNQIITMSSGNSDASVESKYADVVLDSTNVYLQVSGTSSLRCIGWIDNIISF